MTEVEVIDNCPELYKEHKEKKGFIHKNGGFFLKYKYKQCRNKCKVLVVNNGYYEMTGSKPEYLIII